MTSIWWITSQIKDHLLFYRGCVDPAGPSALWELLRVRWRREQVFLSPWAHRTWWTVAPTTGTWAAKEGSSPEPTATSSATKAWTQRASTPTNTRSSSAETIHFIKERSTVHSLKMFFFFSVLYALCVPHKSISSLFKCLSFILYFFHAWKCVTLLFLFMCSFFHISVCFRLISFFISFFLPVSYLFPRSLTTSLPPDVDFKCHISL